MSSHIPDKLIRRFAAISDCLICTFSYAATLMLLLATDTGHCRRLLLPIRQRYAAAMLHAMIIIAFA